ncbi:hypothetical protein A3D77_00405 [Candidatus Gottesmanbacteria bacterium RIFCSPHIGHO2_02_FULL_39_11]|uniref:Uncharacterized protein n=1 Tax=Candidatus Gottesmanbacteria bacterium RIFCSPHIGHO2_02_FULL_39_11 TaxID=1798382 RepID=A0A1F5ZLB9_9BACT|nr:MAG: hypothetical protein A3D77_00405 [Candidatus Gottesmanbacteria bacterium RIFCSPHIGHO2_02_FULL_39_11]
MNEMPKDQGPVKDISIKDQLLGQVDRLRNTQFSDVYRQPYPRVSGKFNAAQWETFVRPNFEKLLDIHGVPEVIEMPGIPSAEALKQNGTLEAIRRSETEHPQLVKDSDSFEKGVETGLGEALDFIGITRAKGSSDPADVCAVDVVVNTSGMQSYAEVRNGDDPKKIGPGLRIRRPWRTYGKTDEQAFEDVFKENCPDESSSDFFSFKYGYQSGSYLAVLYYLNHTNKVQIHPVEQIAKAFPNR